jgi:hypothetical protein
MVQDKVGLLRGGHGQKDTSTRVAHPLGSVEGRGVTEGEPRAS